MTGKSPEDAAAELAPLRPTLVQVAYRMLGSIADAEDAVQESLMRWIRQPRTEVRVPEALRRIVTRVCLEDSSLRSATVRPTSDRGCPTRWSRKKRSRT